MGRERGAKNIRRYNETRSKRNAALIREVLSHCKASKLYFGSFGLVCCHVSRITGIHRTTLSRNLQYRSELMSYLATQKGSQRAPHNGRISSPGFDPELSLRELEAANLRNEVRRLKMYIQHAGLPPEAELAKGVVRAELDSQRFVDTAMALSAVLARLHEILILDRSKGTIEDLAAPPSRRTVVGSKRLAAFIAWFDDQGSQLSSMDSK
jgi:hypothetical protein